MTSFGVHEIEALLARTRQGLESMRGGQVDSEAPGEERRGEGEALDGQIRATVSGGRVESISVQPQVMRLPAERLCEHIVLAVNAAYDTYRSAVQAPAVDAVDPQALAAQLQDLQEQSLRQMSTFGAAMEDVLARMRSARADRG